MQRYYVYDYEDPGQSFTLHLLALLCHSLPMERGSSTYMGQWWLTSEKVMRFFFMEGTLLWATVSNNQNLISALKVFCTLLACLILTTILKGGHFNFHLVVRKQKLRDIKWLAQVYLTLLSSSSRLLTSIWFSFPLPQLPPLLASLKSGFL